MRWSDVRAAHPDQWLVVEALEAHSENDHRIFDRIAVVEVCSDGRAAMKRYSDLQREHRHREFCFVHTSKGELEFEERLWLGIRGLRATDLSA
jgi:hypothetical protein